MSNRPDLHTTDHAKWDQGGYCNELVTDDDGCGTVCGYRQVDEDFKNWKLAMDEIAGDDFASRVARQSLQAVRPDFAARVAEEFPVFTHELSWNGDEWWVTTRRNNQPHSGTTLDYFMENRERDYR